MGIRKKVCEIDAESGYTFSFFSVSSFNEADRDSRVSPAAVDDAPLDLMRDCLRAEV